MKRMLVLGVSLLSVAALMLGCSDDDGGSGIGQPGEPGGFLWKPRSESDGRLVVLLPPQYRGNVASTYVANPSGDIIEVGRFAGDTHNGDRPHYRFTQQGAAYGTDIYVVAELLQGGLVHWPIANGADRIEY